MTGKITNVTKKRLFCLIIYDWKNSGIYNEIKFGLVVYSIENLIAFRLADFGNKIWSEVIYCHLRVGNKSIIVLIYYI